MARTPMVVYPLSRELFTTDTIAPGTVGDAVNNMVINNDGGTFLEVVNADAGAPHTFGVEIPRRVDTDLTVTTRTFTVPASGRGRTGTFPTDIYGAQLLLDPGSNQLTFQAFSVIQ